MQVAKDKVVTIDYTLTGPQGNVLDSSQGRGPLAYLHGAGNIIPGLEQALEGKNEGEKLSVNVPPDQGYGSRDERMVQSVPRERFRGVENIQPGMQFQANTPAGSRVVTVVAVDPQNVRVDANHPLAGVPLKFDVTVVGVRDASAEELSHRHVHGAGGHQH
jgi:FKBP-type peptidyl-prolyl cis-trans isomerase SlyD